MSSHKVSTKAESIRVLKRAGVPPKTIRRVMAELPDVIDFDVHARVYERHGITLNGLLESMGSSP